MDGYTIAKNGNRIPKQSRVRWDLLIEWNDGTTNWVHLKDLKEWNPIELSEYAIAKKYMRNLSLSGELILQYANAIALSVKQKQNIGMLFTNMVSAYQSPYKKHYN